MMPTLVKHALKEGYELAKAKENELRLEIASKEGAIANAKSELVQYQAATKYIEELNATESVLQ